MSRNAGLDPQSAPQRWRRPEEESRGSDASSLPGVPQGDEANSGVAADLREARIAQLWRRASPPPPLSPEAFKRLEANLGRASPPVPFHGFGAAPAAAAALGALALAAAATYPHWRAATRRSPPAPAAAVAESERWDAPVQSAASLPVTRSPDLAGGEPPAAVARQSQGPGASAPIAKPPNRTLAPSSQKRPARPASTYPAARSSPLLPSANAPSDAPVGGVNPPPANLDVPPAPPDAIFPEGHYLAEAVVALHRHDPSGALAELSIYRHHFPHGALAPEADTTQLEADLQLGAKGDALALLDRLAAAGYADQPRQAELRVLRAELMAQGGRCAEALADLAPLFVAPSPAADGDLGERALFTRATCRAREGDPAGARADVARYLERFPHGKFAEKARGAFGQ